LEPVAAEQGPHRQRSDVVTGRLTVQVDLDSAHPVVPAGGSHQCRSGGDPVPRRAVADADQPAQAVAGDLTYFRGLASVLNAGDLAWTIAGAHHPGDGRTTAGSLGELELDQ